MSKQPFFFDWLSIYQEHPGVDLPFLGERACQYFDTVTGEVCATTQPPIRHKGSYSTSISVKVSGARITVKGNPSRFGRPDNLFGYTSLEDCVAVYNRILLELGLPPFTKGTRIGYLQSKRGEKTQQTSDGAVLIELHLTQNKGVGRGCVDNYLKALSTQRFRSSIPRLHSNGKAVDWLSKKGNARLIYPSVYDKANEMELHLLDKIKRLHGEKSSEVDYVKQVIQFCEEQGIIRFEQKLKSAYLRRENLRYYGFIDNDRLCEIHNQFIQVDSRLKVNNMKIEGISEQLRNEGICTSTYSANITAMYAIQWMHGQHFDLGKSQVKTHRARLRRIGIDIAEPCDLTRFSPVRVIGNDEITVSDVEPPAWYRMPSREHLQLVA